MSVLVTVSLGELIDKISILRIKHRRFVDSDKLRNVARELTLLEQTWRETVIASRDVESLVLELEQVNEALWDIEDRLRAKEAEGTFDDEFVGLARRVYFTNDRRAEIKRAINQLLGSEIVEEKQYVSYQS